MSNWFTNLFSNSTKAQPFDEAQSNLAIIQARAIAKLIQRRADGDVSDKQFQDSMTTISNVVLEDPTPGIGGYFGDALRSQITSLVNLPGDAASSINGALNVLISNLKAFPDNASQAFHDFTVKTSQILSRAVRDTGNAIGEVGGAVTESTGKIVAKTGGGLLTGLFTSSAAYTIAAIVLVFIVVWAFWKGPLKDAKIAVIPV